MVKAVEKEKKCYEAPVNTSFVPPVFAPRYFNYPPPETLSLEELRKDLKERKGIVREFAMNEAIVSEALVPLYAAEGLVENATVHLLPLLETLGDVQDPDFTIVILARVMFTTPVFDELILPYLKDIPLWVTKGEKLRIYWTENHMFMYTTSAYLLRQKFPEQFPALDDPTLDNRLLWLLKSKAEHGFFEFNSHLYMGFTLSALLNLYDFSADAEIKELARKCVTRLLMEWMQVTNSYGVSAVASSRTNQLFYFTGECPSDRSRMYARSHQEAMCLITGQGPLVIWGTIDLSTSFLLLSDFDLALIAASYTPELYETKSSGTSYNDGIEFLFKNLSHEDRIMAQFSLGGYISEDYILDFLDFARTYELWDHEVFSSSKFMTFLPDGITKTLAGAIASVGAGSILYVPDIKLYKNNEVMLSSLNNYIAGKKGYQQFAGTAVIGDAAVFTQSVATNVWNTTEVKDQRAANNQMPFLLQDHNLLVSIYNPNLDLSLISSSAMEVGLNFDYRNFDEVIDGRDVYGAEDKWLFGKLGEGYIAVYRHCINDNHDFKVCFDHKQVWITLVGNNMTHGTFSEFMNEVVDNSEFDCTIGRKCVFVQGVVDGKDLEVKFCRELGGTYVLLIIVIFYVVFQATCCFVCCRKKRTVWKHFVRNTLQAVDTSRDNADVKEEEKEASNNQPQGMNESVTETDKFHHYIP